MANQPLFRIEPTLAGRRRECVAFARSPLTNSVLIYAICVLVVAGCVFLSQQQLARKSTVVGRAELAEGELKLYPNSRRIVETMLVQDGDFVRKGQTLAVLRSLDYNRTNTTQENSNQPVQPALVLLASLKRERANLLATRTAIQKETAANRATLALQSRGLKRTIRSQYREAAATIQLVDLAREQLERGRELHLQGHLSLSQLEELQRRYAEQQKAVASSERDALALREQQRALTHEFEQLAQTLPNKLRQIDSRLGGNERESARQNMSLEQQLVAPTDGLVTGVLSHAGATVDPQRPLITMVRNGARFRARLWATSNAAGELASGQTVRLMLDAFPHQKHGMLGGSIQHINESPLTLKELGTPWEGSGSVYGVTVTLDTASPLYAQLKPGMNLTADIKLDDSLLLHRLFEPLIKAWQRTL